MTDAYVLSFAKNALLTTLILAGPFLISSLIIGVLVSLFQAVTQINEITLTFVPKIIVSGLVIILVGSWMAQQLIAFTANIFINLPSMPR